MILLTGASGMLGRYIADEFKDEDIVTLGRAGSNDIICDLKKESPDFSSKDFSTVIHCAGTEENTEAEELNHKGTMRLLEALGNRLPQNFVYISSWKVYSPDAGENVNEETQTWAIGEAGQSKARAEEELRHWALQNDVTLTIIRPARIFGEGVGGETLRLFNDALSGKYIHIRGNDARTSVVTALDIAKGIKKIYTRGGIYNAADGRNPKFLEMMEAMTENAGARKRMNHLPIAWAEWLWRICRWIPSIDRNLSPKVVENRMKSFTIDGRKFSEVTGNDYYDTLNVMERKHSSYPYGEINNKSEAVSYEA